MFKAPSTNSTWADTCKDGARVAGPEITQKNFLQDAMISHNSSRLLGRNSEILAKCKQAAGLCGQSVPGVEDLEATGEKDLADCELLNGAI